MAISPINNAAQNYLASHARNTLNNTQPGDSTLRNALNNPQSGGSTSGDSIQPQPGNGTSGDSIQSGGSTQPGTGNGTSGDSIQSGGSTSGDSTITPPLFDKNPSVESQQQAQQNKDPNALDKDAFLKLFLEQLKAQDPTAPMETNQILEQSAMMTQIEQQQQMKQTLETMTDSIKQMSESSTKLTELQTKMSEVLTNLSQNIGENTAISNLIAQLGAYNSSGVVGKIAETSISTLPITKENVGQPQTFDIWFDEAINLQPYDATSNPNGNDKAKIVIKDKDGAIVKELPLDQSAHGKKGYISFTWDGKDKGGLNVIPGEYTITAEYNTGNDKQPKVTKIGRGEVMGLAFEGGVPFVKLGSSTSPLNYYSLLTTTQFYSKESTTAGTTINSGIAQRS